MATDDKEIFFIRKDLSGGQNNRIHGSNIGDNQATVLYNVDIGTPFQTSKRPGLGLIQDIGNNAGTGLFGFEPDGGTNVLLVTEGSNLSSWPGSGSFTNRYASFTSGLQTTMIKTGEQGNNDVVLVSNGTDNVQRMTQGFVFADLGDTNTSPPKTTVMTSFRNRVWTLKSNLLSYSSAFPSDYSTAFDRTTNAFRMPVGTERAVIGIRDAGLIVMGNDQVWGINPSSTPAATDLPEKILDIGCAAGKTAVQVGDDIYFLAYDGVRGVFRTQQDKLQQGASYPLSYVLKDEVASLSWGYITKSCAVYFDNKYFISVPVDGSTYCNEVWAYYPASQGWMIITGWNVAAWSKMKVNGEERLYAVDSTDGKVYRAWSGYDDNGTAINYQEEGRKEDMGQPLVTKTGGVYKLRALSSGNYTVSVYVSIDDADYTLLGTMSLSAGGLTLPFTLPATLSGQSIVEESFHLDSLGPWRQIRFKIQHNDTNGNDTITFYDRSLTTYSDEYSSE
jgi:hypothetical protein